MCVCCTALPSSIVASDNRERLSRRYCVKIGVLGISVCHARPSVVQPRVGVDRSIVHMRRSLAAGQKSLTHHAPKSCKPHRARLATRSAPRSAIAICSVQFILVVHLFVVIRLCSQRLIAALAVI